MYAILGSGFGIYGYLPALAEGCSEKVILPLAYKAKVLAREELTNTLDKIYWVKSHIDALSEAGAVVIARTPQLQYTTALHCLSFPNIEKIILEKPVAATPELSAILVNNLDSTNKRYRIGFTFLYTKWNKQLNWSKLLMSEDELFISWTFTANHFAKKIDTWKRYRSEGGGVLRFYGVHLLALLAARGYDGVKESKIEYEDPEQPLCWRAVFTGTGLPNFNVYVNTLCTEKRFEIGQMHKGVKRILFRVEDPFETERSEGNADSRVDPLISLIRTFDSDDNFFKRYYRDVINLWAATECT